MSLHGCATGQRQLFWPSTYSFSQLSRLTIQHFTVRHVNQIPAVPGGKQRATDVVVDKGLADKRANRRDHHAPRKCSKYSFSVVIKLTESRNVEKNNVLSVRPTRNIFNSLVIKQTVVWWDYVASVVTEWSSKHWWNDPDMGKQKCSNLVSVPLCPPQIPYGVA